MLIIYDLKNYPKGVTKTGKTGKEIVKEPLSF